MLQCPFRYIYLESVERRYLLASARVKELEKRLSELEEDKGKPDTIEDESAEDGNDTDTDNLSAIPSAREIAGSGFVQPSDASSVSSVGKQDSVPIALRGVWSKNRAKGKRLLNALSSFGADERGILEAGGQRFVLSSCIPFAVQKTKRVPENHKAFLDFLQKNGLLEFVTSEEALARTEWWVLD